MEFAEIVARLHSEQCSCVIGQGEEVRICRERGVKDLYRLLKEQPEVLRGAYVADKVVGKGAAALLILGGVQRLFAELISRSALALLEESGIPVEYTRCVPYIINRQGTGMCPVETLCQACRTAAECLPRIEQFMAATPRRPLPRPQPH